MRMVSPSSRDSTAGADPMGSGEEPATDFTAVIGADILGVDAQGRLVVDTCGLGVITANTLRARGLPAVAADKRLLAHIERERDAAWNGEMRGSHTSCNRARAGETG